MSVVDKQLLIIDCDAGVDDAEAIMLALRQPRHAVEVLAITCVDGNTSLDNVTKNVLRVLKLCNRQEIPVYRGAEQPLLGARVQRAENIHGGDGLGGMSDTVPLDDKDTIEEETAPSALVRIVRQQPGQITLVATGPLTNLVLAQRCWSNFGSSLKELIIMGGDCTGRGNRKDLVTAEFNFGIDPEAASIVLREFECSKHIVPYDVCMESAFSWDWHTSWLRKGDKITKFLAGMHETIRKGREAAPGGSTTMGYYSCDLYTMAYAIDKHVASKLQTHHVDVECQGSHLTRGMLVIDHRSILGKPINVAVVTKMNMERLKTHLEHMLRSN